ncbi:MAG: hypothetical protein LUJ25_05465 [Firmicutes bacterium]|nr:hypothetical protein [Bacillota bacterium]
MGAAFISKAVHVPVYKTLRLKATKLIATVAGFTRKGVHALICVVVNLDVTALNTVVVSMLQVLVAVAFAVWISVAIALITV